MREAESEIKVYSDLVVFHQSGIPHKFHANHGLKIIIAEEQFSVVHDHRVINSTGVIIRPDTTHKINTGPWIIISDPTNFNVELLAKNIETYRKEREA